MRVAQYSELEDYYGEQNLIGLKMVSILKYRYSATVVILQGFSFAATFEGKRST